MENRKLNEQCSSSSLLSAVIREEPSQTLSAFTSTSVTSPLAFATYTSTDPSGCYHHIQRDTMHAIIAEEGAHVCSYKVAGRELLTPPVTANVSCSDAIIPFASAAQRMPIHLNDRLPIRRRPSFPAPLHEVADFSQRMNWIVLNVKVDRLALGLIWQPQEDYSFILSLKVTFVLTRHGLGVKTLARNIGSAALSYDLTSFVLQPGEVASSQWDITAQG